MDFGGGLQRGLAAQTTYDVHVYVYVAVILMEF